MNRFKSVSFFLIFAHLAAYGFVNTAMGQDVSEYTSFEIALEAAKSSNKNLALYFHADDWDVPAHFGEVLPDNHVLQRYLAQDYLIVNIDVNTEAGALLSEKYNTLGIKYALALVGNQENSLGYMSLLDASTEDYLAFFLNTDLLHNRRQYSGE